MKKITLALAIAWLSMAMTSMAEFKFAVVDMEKIFSEYSETKDADKRINERKEEIKKQLDERRDVLKRLVDQMRDLQKIITDEAVHVDVREQKRKELQDVSAEGRALEREMEEFSMRKKQQLAESTSRERRRILEKINALVCEVSNRQGYQIIFDKSAKSISGVPAVLCTRDEHDISQSVIDSLNAQAGSK